MEIIKRLCSEGEADAEHTYFYYYFCPNCKEFIGYSLDKDNYRKCPNCNEELEYKEN